MNNFETTYDKVLEKILGFVNPVKKSIIKTQCQVHKSINISALNILKNDKYTKEYYFFNKYVEDLNEGTVWADQDFKSSNHFFNPYEKKGLYGRKNAMDLGLDYYENSLKSWKSKKYNESLFYLGATLHIIQDMTIPQHANIRLLDNHRQYETYIKSTYEHIKDFQVEKGAHILDSVEDYIRFNARVAMRIYKKFKSIPNEREKFYKIAKCGLPLAKKTTAGAMVLFYNEILLEDNPN
ncbi:MAG: zinc dependent phospholipase C family protein [Tissierellaceae bacterium]